MGVLSLEALKGYLKISEEATNEDQESLLQTITAATNKAVESYCNRIFDTAALIDEVYDGTDSIELWLRRTPVTALSAIKFGYTNPTTIDSTYYQWQSNGRVIFISGLLFEQHPNYWLISYTGGYDAAGMPADLVWAACKIAALDFKEQDAGRIGLTSKSVGGEVVESYIRELPVEVKSVLNHYRRIFL